MSSMVTTPPILPGLGVARRPQPSRARPPVSRGSAVPAETPGEERARRGLSQAATPRATYGFDDVSLAPGTETLDPADVDTTVEIGGVKLAIPILAAAMDAV